jgi:hypothetical protein
MLLGALPPVAGATPWWNDMEPLVAAVRAHYGVEITVLRLLSVGEPQATGVEVTYLAETNQAVVAAKPWDEALADHPLRLPYAKPGGPRADLDWAAGVLARRGLAQDGAPVQVRTWNLSSLWRLRADERTFWLKVTPPFMAREGAILEALAGGPVPTLIGREGARILMPEIPGEDLYFAGEPTLARMVDLIVDLQRGWIGRTAALLGLGLNDWRGPPLARAIAETFERNADVLAKEDRARLIPFVEALDERFAKVAACGLPETLVHGDFHPGNLRGDGETLTLLDWGDSGVGHPLLDEPAFLEHVPSDAAPALRRRWHLAWEAAAPGSQPGRASSLLAPIAALRQAVIYQGFLDCIEPSEHPYHQTDPADRLGRAARLLEAEEAGA